MDKEISDFLKFAIENNRIKDINEAFEEFPPKYEWHQGKIENVLMEENEEYNTYEIGDIVFVRRYLYSNGSYGENHFFVIVEQNNIAVPIENFGMLISSRIEKLKYKSNLELKRDKKDRVLSIRDLNISFKTNYGLVNAIRGVRLDLFKGETIAIVGESGSGKSVTCKTIMGILDSNGVIESGEINYYYKDENGNDQVCDLTKLSQKEIRYKFCGKKISMVFQDPMTSLDPTMTIAKQIMEPMLEHQKISKKEAYDRTLDLLTKVGIENPEKRMKQYPHELSGGMRQRVVIAIALASDPDILICDEPTTALDVTIQAKILELIKQLQDEKGISVIYITHDLGVVAKVADYVAVMYAGRIVEKGRINEIFYDPRHPYTWGLLASMPDTETDTDRLYAIAGTPPDLTNRIKGDAFAPRNPYALNIDFEAEPPLFNVGGQHRVASWLCDPRAPKIDLPDELKVKIVKMKKEANIND